MMQPPRHLVGQRQLPQRATDITIRPLRPTDVGLIDAMHQRLTPESVYARYLQHRNPTFNELAAVCSLERADGAGFVATQPETDIIVGLAYYVRETQATEPTAEPGILVEDLFQEQGIGRHLWQRLQRQAQQDGLQWLRVLSHPSNQRMAQLVRGGGLPYAAKGNGGINEYLVALASQPEPHQWGQAAAYTHLTATATRPTLIGQWRSVQARLTWNWKLLPRLTRPLLQR